MSLFNKEIIVKKNNNGETEIHEFRMNSEKDSYDKPSRKVTRILGQMDPERRNNETTIRLYLPTRPFGELDRTHRPTRRTGELDRANRPTRPFGEFD